MTDKKTIYAAYKSGNTYLEIAEKYDLTKGKVAGIIRRYREAMGIKTRIGERIKPMQEPANDIPLPPPIEVNTVDEWLHSGRCRYIGGEGDNRTFCGHERKRGKPWCEDHYKICMLPIPKKQ